MSEPRLEDDGAFFDYERCDDCGERHSQDDSCYEDDPDRMHDEMYED
jgi:hypothetical protein